VEFEWKRLSGHEQLGRLVESRKEIALERTTEAQHLLETLRNILIAGIEPDPTLDWDQLKIRTPFPVRAPAKPVVTESLGEPIPAPNRFDRRYQIRFSLLDRLIASKERNQALRS
jgi:restriction system protein